MAMWSIYGELLKQSHTISCVQTDSESSHVWALSLPHTHDERLNKNHISHEHLYMQWTRHDHWKWPGSP